MFFLVVLSPTRDLAQASLSCDLFCASRVGGFYSSGLRANFHVCGYLFDHVDNKNAFCFICEALVYQAGPEDSTDMCMVRAAEGLSEL